MKLPTLLLAGSLLGNAALVGALIVQPSRLPAPLRDLFSADTPRAAASPPVTPSSALSSQPASRGSQLSTLNSQLPLWPALASDDLRTLVARLRAAGFPAHVIRSVIERRLSDLYTPRLRALEQADPNTPFWKIPSPYYSAGDKRLEDINLLYRERTKLSRELLRDHALADDDITAAQRRQFGPLSPAKVDQLQRIEDDYAEMQSALRAATQGIMLPEDREKFALLAREKSADLAAILTPEELADYELRTSATTRFLRGRLTAFDPSEGEFRAIYAAQQAVNARFVGGPVEAQTMDRTARDAVADAYNAQLLAGLGAARYAEFLRSSDQSFQQLTRLAQQNSIPAPTAQLAYELRDTASRESNRILDDTTLSRDQQVAALKALAQTSRQQINALLGPKVGATYATVSGQWLGALDRGVAFSTRGAPLTIISEGSTMSYSGSISYRSPGTPTR